MSRSIEGRVRRIEEKVLAEPMICRYVDGARVEKEGSLDDMIREHGGFVRVVRGGSLEEGKRMLDYVLGCWEALSVSSEGEVTDDGSKGFEPFYNRTDNCSQSDGSICS